MSFPPDKRRHHSQRIRRTANEQQACLNGINCWGKPTTRRTYQSMRVAETASETHNFMEILNSGNCESASEVHTFNTLDASSTTKSNISVAGVTKRRRKYQKLSSDEPAACISQSIPTSQIMLSPPTICEHCDAKKFQYESPGFCCSNGEVKIATNPFPPEIDRFFTSQEEDATHFQCFARPYNNLFAFSSLGGTIDCKKHKGIYTFRLHGQIYHFLPNLIPSDSKPKYLQLYFYDAQQEQAHREGVFKELRPEIIAIIMKIMDKNPYAMFFRHLHQMQIDEDTTIHINKNAALDQRVYNAPTSDEVAAIWPDQSVADDNTGPYIVVHGKSDTTHRIKHYYGCYDPLQYPLLFPAGESGWHPGIPRLPQKEKKATNTLNTAQPNAAAPVQQASDAKDLIAQEEKLASGQPKKKKKKDISCREYYACLLQIRYGNRILASGRLLLQFIVDMYVKLENTRLDFLRNNQPTIRADLYQGILDTILLGEVQGANAGHRVVLPPSFIGGPRDLRRRYFNAMQLVQRFGKPDIFATMTCNPNWAEIKAELREGELAQNRPDLLTRIFRAKLIHAKKEIMENKIFGEVAAFIYVVEFQKRGLPHAHFLIILESDFKIKCPEHFDKFMCAEIPPTTTPHLRAAVLNHMMHGPCGEINPKCACMKQKEGKHYCKSHFPKPFTSFTTNKEDGYPMYRRRDTGEKVRIRGHDMDNRWVIPYNPYLLAVFDCHFNVEICSTIQAVKYLYKYVYKGHDQVSFNIGQSNTNEPVDEIERFQSGRWVSAPEAAWRIFGFDLYEMYPPVMPLNIHCDKSQRVHFGAQENLQNVVSNPVRVQTPLTEFFRINKENPDGEKYLYAEFPEHYRWDDHANTWIKRKRGKMIGRLAFATPAEGDRFFIRSLLAKVRAPTSFDDLKTIDGHKCAGYQEACLKRKIIEPCNMTEQCLNEAVEVQMPSALRSLFVTLLIFSHPPNPRYLWEQYYLPLSEDFRNRFPHQPEKVLSLTAEKIEQHLETMGKKLSEFGLDHLRNVQNESLRITRDVRDAIEAPLSQKNIHARKHLNVKQKEAYKCIVQHVKSNQGGAFFIDGPGGTGKTFLYKALYGKVRLLGKIPLATASSGIAAAGLPNGRTAHSRFKLPIDHDSSLTCDVPKQGTLAALLKEAKLIIWDEAPMANKASIHALDLLLRDLCDPNSIFGGKIVVLGGDFRQVLLVVPNKAQIEAIDASLVSSRLWPQFRRFYLTENMRAKEDPSFASFLLNLGDGKLQQQEQEMIQLPSNIPVASIQTESLVNNLLEMFLPDQSKAEWNPKVFADQAILTARNDGVDALN